MKQYIGTKIIQAEPAYRLDKKTVQPADWPIPAGSQADEGYAVRYPDGYMSWSPKATFEEAYRPTDAMTFGLAIEAAKRGKRIARKGWNGKGQYVELAEAINYTCPDGTVVNAEHDAIGNRAFVLVWTSGVQLGWLASQADMLAEDWEIVE